MFQKSIAQIAIGFACAVAVAACSASPVVLTPSGAVRTAVPSTAVPSTAAPIVTATPIATAVPTATATPVATATPTATASSAIVANPASIALISDPTTCPSNTSEAFTVSESGYGGAFAATSSNTSVLTVVSNGGGAFTATESSTDTAASSATVTVTDTLGHSLAIPASFQITCIAL